MPSKEKSKRPRRRIAGNSAAVLADKSPFKSALRRVLAQDATDAEVKRVTSQLRRAATQLLNKAARGDLSAIRELADRCDGKPRQELSGTDGGPVVVEILRFADAAAEADFAQP